MANPLVSVIVVTHDDEELVPRFLGALRETRYEPFEILVVDNASTDGTLALLNAAEDVTVVPQKVGRGPGVAGNRGAEAARGELLVHMNSDVFVTPDWLTLMVEHIQQRPDVGILSATTLYPGQTEPEKMSPMALQEVAAVPGCAMMVPRHVWEELGGYDENFFLYWLDTDFCWRAWYRGWKVVEDLQAMVHHEEGGSTRGEVWAADQIKGCLYTHLKLMRWRQTAVFAGLMAGKTLRYLGRADTRTLLGAWGWNLRRLPRTLRERRRWAEPRRRLAPQLERMFAVHQRRQLRERRERRALEQQPLQAA